MSNTKFNVGYTLIEVIVALSVFAIIATITSSVMYHVFDTRARVALKASQLDELQLIITLLEHDAAQFVPRTVRADDVRTFPAFTGTRQYMEFTRGGLVNPHVMTKRSTLKRVAYLCKNNAFIRRSWESLDLPDRTRFEDRILLEKLKTCSFSYISKYHQIIPEWQVFSVEKNQKIEILPSGVQLTINPFGWGDMVLLFVFSEGLYA